VSLVTYKYALNNSLEPNLRIPCGARFLHIGVQGTTVCIWCLVDPMAPLDVVLLNVYGTGDVVTDPPETYLGTVFVGPFVWHVFDRGHFFRRDE